MADDKIATIPPATTPAAAPAAPRPGRPRKYADPAPGEDVPANVRYALKNRVDAAARFHANPEVIRERNRASYHARMAKFKAAVQQVEAIRATVAA